MGIMEWYPGNKCNDCGQPINEEPKHSRKDVCPSCWDTRGELARGNIVTPGSPECIAIQRKMATGRGTAKRYIDQIKASIGSGQ